MGRGIGAAEVGQVAGREGAGEGEEEENLKGASGAKVILYLFVFSAPKSFVLNSKYTVY